MARRPAPLLGVLHGTYAHLGVTAFWRRERGQTPRADIEFAHWRAATLTAAETLLGDADLTPVGRFFVEHIAATLREWTADPVPPAAAAAAESILNEHRAAWRRRTS